MTNRKNRVAVMACIAAWLLGAAIAFSADQLKSGTPDHLRLADLQSGDTVVLKTAIETYEFKIIDAQRASAMANRMENSPTRDSLGFVRLLGATAGQQGGGLTLVEMGVIRCGMKLELGLGDLHSTNRFQTEPITDIKINK